jgi:FixJ family two-component response regulator
MQSTTPVIAIVDDDGSVRRALRRLVLSMSYQPADFASGEEFLDSLQHGVPDCAILDLHMPGLTGLDLLNRLRASDLNVPAIIVTANQQPEMRTRCLSAGAIAYLQKPLDSEILSQRIKAALAAVQ